MAHRVFPSTCPRKKGTGYIFDIRNFTDPIQDRKGSDMDLEYLKYLLEEEWSLETYVYSNKRKAKLKGLLSKICSKFVTKRHDKLVIVFSSHGGEDYLVTSDMKHISHREIIRYFKDFRTDIPKIFIFNQCREAKSEYTLKQTWADVEVIVPRKWPNFVTLCLCQKGTVSYRSETDGSFGISNLYKSFVSYGRDMHFESFLDKFSIEAERQSSERTAKQEIIDGENDEIHTQRPVYRSTLKTTLFFPQVLSSNGITLDPKSVISTHQKGMQEDAMAA